MKSIVLNTYDDLLSAIREYIEEGKKNDEGANLTIFKKGRDVGVGWSFTNQLSERFINYGRAVEISSNECAEKVDAIYDGNMDDVYVTVNTLTELLGKVRYFKLGNSVVLWTDTVTCIITTENIEDAINQITIH